MSELKWKKAVSNQPLWDGDVLLVTGTNPKNGKRWYDVVTVECDENLFNLRNGVGEDAEIDWSEIDYWCYDSSIPKPEDVP
jgi:hypothetical protein